MHSIKLEINDSVFDKVLYFLQNLPKDEVRIVENSDDLVLADKKSELNTKAYSNHTANLIEDWKDDEEDEIWK